MFLCKSEVLSQSKLVYIHSKTSHGRLVIINVEDIRTVFLWNIYLISIFTVTIQVNVLMSVESVKKHLNTSTTLLSIHVYTLERNHTSVINVANASHTPVLTPNT